jgi:hypothetical protein
MRKLAERLSYSNVMATVAVFIALGAGAYAAVSLPKNSVKSKHIKNAQVKNKDLRDQAVSTTKLRDAAVGSAKLAGDIRPLHFDGELNIGGLTDVILEEEGYRITMRCDDDGGSPQLEGTLRVPEDGTLDLQVVGSNAGVLEGQAVQVDVTAAAAFEFDVPDPASGQVHATGVTLTYSGATRAALISLHAVSSDASNTCSLNGSLIPLTQVE